MAVGFWGSEERWNSQWFFCPGPEDLYKWLGATFFCAHAICPEYFRWPRGSFPGKRGATPCFPVWAGFHTCHDLGGVLLCAWTLLRFLVFFLFFFLAAAWRQLSCRQASGLRNAAQRAPKNERTMWEQKIERTKKVESSGASSYSSFDLLFVFSFSCRFFCRFWLRLWCWLALMSPSQLPWHVYRTPVFSTYSSHPDFI